MSKQKAPEVNLANLYHELNKFAQNADYSNPRALNVANKILKANRGDETAFKCKIVCLIHQSQFQIAVKEIVNNPNLAGGLAFEKAYCQYRLNKIPEALSTIRNVSDPSPKLQELLGQVLYRLEQYSECVGVYKNLIKNTSDDYEEERQTNLSAVIAGLKLWENKDVEDPGLEDETWELNFNRACLLIGQANYPEALERLVQAEQLCREMMEEDDDVEAELGVIHVQRAYVLQLQGKNDEALKLYNQVVKSRSYRYAGYRMFTYWVHGLLGRGVRRVIPACAVQMIRSTFPKADGNYVEFRYGARGEQVEVPEEYAI